MKHRIAFRGIAGAFSVAIVSSCTQDETPNYTPTQIDSIVVMSPDEVEYQPLNPARGDASPKAGVLWGDIREDVPSGILLQFAEGFSSPPHIHNITYRAVVISGEVHNDDPNAENMWMGPGTFWTQPAGEVHITSARPGVGATAFLEILEGPYLVQPSEMAFDNGEQPLNLVNSNLVWLGPEELSWIETDKAADASPEIAFLWGDLQMGELSGSFVKIPVGHEVKLFTVGGDLKAVMIQGYVEHSVPGVTTPSTLGAGGYFASAEKVTHAISCSPESECLIYVSSPGQLGIR